MSLLQKISDFLQSLFSPNSPESIQRQAVKRIENDLRVLAPNLYKGGLIQPSFAETLRILFQNTEPILDLLSQTLCSNDLEVSRKFEEQLLLTGFSEEAKVTLEEFAYEKRKSGAMEAESITRYFEGEHRKLEKVIRELNSQEFIRIDTTLDRIKQLNDICRFSYVTALKIFDNGFSTKLDYVPDFQPLPPDLLESSLLDLYFVMADMDITNSVYNAVLALAKLTKGGSVSDSYASNLKDNFKKIQSIVKHVLTKEVLMGLIRIAKKNCEFIPDRSVYKGNCRQKYADYLENRFRVDEARLKSEIQDATISNEINQIFGQIQLVPVNGYSKELDNQLRQSTPCSFLWITPMQLLKNFVKFYFIEHVKPLLNDIVIEGFFMNQSYKSEFSSAVFALNDVADRLEAFEAKFKRGAVYDEANITSLIRDSHKDSSFESTLKDMVDRVNKTAKEVVQTETTNVFQLYKKINDILVESKKPSSDVIQNLKVLMISSRNRDNSDFMESQYGQWKVFLEIMKNYVIIGTIEKK
ncbi:DUF5312 family protein [Treponema sp.]|uniref:DUF5312 family protein n=1 Tax=Treponema sp. TaxID=166 RepID=UPI00298D609F|nr:DUF5312 family protein [Treponema sp.]MCQ2242307.1 DUF5312 domain-containing protein [Treponema sp.]